MVQVESYGDAGNNAVVKMPGRRFPGVVIQGDTLATLTRIARRVAQRIPQSGVGELLDEATDLADRLEDILARLSEAMDEAGEVKKPW